MNEKNGITSRVYETLRVNGADLSGASNASDNRPVPAKAVQGSIIDLAKGAIDASTATIVEQAVEFASVGGATIEALNCLKEFDSEIQRQEKAARSVLESVRSFKSAMALEMQFLEKAIKQIKDLNITKTIDDLERLKTLTESATIRKLFGQ